MSIDVSFWFKDCRNLTIKDRNNFSKWLSVQYLNEYIYNKYFRDFILSLDDGLLTEDDNLLSYWHMLTLEQQNYLSTIYLKERIERTEYELKSFQEALAQFQDNMIIDKVA
jgi:hypothetical protein